MKVENNKSSEDSKIICGLCGSKLRSITNSHLKYKHKITTTEYKQLFPNQMLISDNHYSKLQKWWNSDKNKAHMIELQLTQSVSKSRIDSVKKAVSLPAYRQNHSQIMKLVVAKNPDKFSVTLGPKLVGINHPQFGKSNWQRWFEKYGAVEADRRLIDWKTKNKLFTKSRETKIELAVHKILRDNDIDFITQFSDIGKYYVDIFIPSKNLVLEVDGDFWHANPKLYDAEKILPFPRGPKMAKEIWERDRIRQSEIESLGYNVVRVFGSEISESYILELLSRYSPNL